MSGFDSSQITQLLWADEKTGRAETPEALLRKSPRLVTSPFCARRPQKPRIQGHQSGRDSPILPQTQDGARLAGTRSERSRRRRHEQSANAGSKRITPTRRTPRRSERSSCATRRPFRPSSRSSGSFSGTAARGGALLRSRETRRRYERETPPPARRDDVRVPFGNKHILLGGGARRRAAAHHPRCRRRYLARQEKQNKERGVGIKPEDRTESQQQKCVSASATVGAFLRYICRCDERNAKRNEECGYGQIGPLTKEQQQACVSASSTVDAC